MTSHCHFVEGFNPEALARSLRHHARRADGIAFMALDHPLVREAVAEIAARGMPVLTMISDIPETPRTAYVGLDNRAAGRTAGLLIGRFVGERRGKVALIAGSRSYRAHEEREIGLPRIIAEAFPALTVVGLREGHDDADAELPPDARAARQASATSSASTISAAPRTASRGRCARRTAARR